MNKNPPPMNFITSSPWHENAWIGFWLWPAIASIIGWTKISTHFNDPIHFDAQYVYLPAARAFLEQGWTYFLTPDSYRVVPLAYLWPALWGGDPSLIRMANAGLWAGCILFLWSACGLLGSHRAGAIAVLLLACHPELPLYFSTELTEPIFLFGLFGWIYSLARILIEGRSSWRTTLLSASMLTITLLSRPVLQLIAPALLLLCLAGMAYVRRHKNLKMTQWQHLMKCLAWSLALGLTPPLILLIKNGVAFGLWGLGTGSGTGLYLGTHPLTQGAEPGFLGFDYDVNSLAALKNGGNGDHLSLVGDKALRNAAIWHIQSISFTDAISFYGRKLWWWLAHHPVQVDTSSSTLRKLRFFELLVLAASIISLAHEWIHRSKKSNKEKYPHRLGNSSPTQRIFIGFLLFMLLGMLAQLIPILYNSRYSSALLDPWLIPLTAWGLANLTYPIQLQGTFGQQGWSLGMTARQGTKFWPAAFALAAILVLTFTSYNFLRRHEQIAVVPHHMGQTATHLDISADQRVETHGLDPQDEHTWVTTESPSVFEVRIEPEDIERLNKAKIFNAMWKTTIALHADRPCHNTDISYHLADGRILQPANKRPLLLPVETDGNFHPLVTHANHEMRPRAPGNLRIVLHCPIGMQVQWQGTQLLESRHVWDAASHIKP